MGFVWPRTEHRVERAGRQDGFCIVCKKEKPDIKLFPQIAPGKIHYCPRRFCEDCVEVKDEWRHDQKPASFVGGGGRYRHVPVCCPLCLRRGWQNVCPLLGPENPEWVGRPPAHRSRIATLRYKTWEIKVNQDVEVKKNSKRRPLDDDGSLASDCQILQDIKSGFLKPGVEFVPASPGDASEKMSWRNRPSQAKMFDPFIIFQIAYNYLIEDMEPDLAQNKDYGFRFGQLLAQPKKKFIPGRSGQRVGPHTIPTDRFMGNLHDPLNQPYGSWMSPLNTSHSAFFPTVPKLGNNSRRPSLVSIASV